MKTERALKNKNKSLLIANLLSWVPSKIYLKVLFKFKTGQKLNLKNPKGFNEKLNWLKLNNKNDALSDYVDKIKAREIVKSKIGDKYLIPTYGSWSSFDEIDFNQLPNSFVLKCNHDSGSAKVIKDKTQLTENDFKELSKFYKNRLKKNMYNFAREYPYLKVKPMIFAEKLMVDESNIELKDYKFFCFKGEPKLYFVASNRGVDTRFDFYDMNNNHLDVYNTHKNADHPVVGKPPFFDEMVKIASQLSESFPFIRIDLYSTNKGVFFGEYTFFHCGGLYSFKPQSWEEKLGDYISLK